MSLLSSEGVSFGGSQSLFTTSANLMTPQSFQPVAAQEVLFNPTRQVQNHSGHMAVNTERVEAVAGRLQPFTQQPEAMFPGAPNFPRPDRPLIPIHDDLPQTPAKPMIEPPIMAGDVERQPRWLDHLIHIHVAEEEIIPPPRPHNWT